MTHRGGRRVGRRQVAGTSRCCSGHVRTAVRGASGRARAQRGAGISRCCSGRARMAARGTRYVLGFGGGRTAGGASVGARERLPVERKHVHVGGKGRPPRDSPMGAREWLPVERGNVLYRGEWQTPRNGAMVDRERVPTVMRPEPYGIKNSLLNPTFFPSPSPLRFPFYIKDTLCCFPPTGLSTRGGTRVRTAAGRTGRRFPQTRIGKPRTPRRRTRRH